MNKKFIIIGILLLLWEFLFPNILYKKSENFEISAEHIPSFISYSFDSLFYKRNYLMANGKYSSEKSIGYSENLIPENIKQISSDISIQKNINKNDILARWIIKSNWGLFSNGNNPFFITFIDAKKIINSLPNSSVILSSYYQWKEVDSTYKLSYTKIASFPDLETCFLVYANLLLTNKVIENYLFQKSLDSLKTILDKEKNFKSQIDSTKLVLFGKDTVQINDSIRIYSYKKYNEYTKIYIPNYLLFTLIVIILIIYFKNDKSI